MSFESDEDVTESFVFDPNEVKLEDDFVLNEENADLPSCNERIPSISDNILNRFEIEASTSGNVDLADAQLSGVSAYDTGKLESGFIQQVFFFYF